MLTRHLRRLGAALFTPLASGLVRLGVSPDVVTVVGTLGVVASALWFFPRGEFVVGPLVVTVVVLADSVDGMMARLLAARGVRRSGAWGAFLDSTLDRVADAAIFVGLVLWFTGPDAQRSTAGAGTAAALACLVLGSVVPYARARAEGLGMTASGGIAERADRITVVLVAVFLHGVGFPAWVLVGALVLLAAASAWTAVQRMAAVHRQARERLAADRATDAGASGSPVAGR
jgi:CDP-diacylglycerol--glycerol-3-phosphate 3-phosphatidyltransferase